MDYCANGNLFKYLETGRKLTVQEVKICSAEIVLAIAFLHERQIVHRDLKLENILISIDFHVLLTDFGLAKKMPRNGKMTGEAGTPTYFAPGTNTFRFHPIYKLIVCIILFWYKFFCLAI